MKRILVLGGGVGGFYAAKGLSERFDAGEARIAVVDRRGYLVYQPFLAEVVGGSIEPRHIQVPLQRHLPSCNVIEAKVRGICSKSKTVTVANEAGAEWDFTYDILVVALGGVTKTFPTPGIAENAIGLKGTEEAMFVRDRLIENISMAAGMFPDDEERKRLLTFVTVGGGFSGMEGFAEAYDLAQKVCDTCGVPKEDLDFHLIEAADRIMPELDIDQAQWVIDNLRERGAHIHLGTFLESAEDNVVVTSDGQKIKAGLIMWTAGQKANPVLANSDLPLDERGRLRCRTDLRVEGDDGIVHDVWGLGDCCRIEDLSGDGLPDGTCAPTAQHACRQSKVLVRNIVAKERGRKLVSYFHPNAGMVAGLGEGVGAFTSGKRHVKLNGKAAWLAHRLYHGFALPSAERKIRVWGDWLEAALLSRDTTTMTESSRPKASFKEHAERA